MKVPKRALAVFLLGSIAGGPMAVGQASGGGTISAFEADADVYAVGVTALVTEVVGLPVEVYGVRARATMDSGPRATALAGPVDVPLGAAFGLLGIPVELPTSCQAFFPGTPTVDCGAVPGDAPGSIVGVGSGHAEADGEPDDITSPTASATAASSSVKSPLYRLGAGQSTASTDVDGGHLTARSALKASDIRLAGGALELNGVSSYARAESTGEREGGVASADLAVTDGSIAGIVPFTVSDKGILFKFPGIPAVPVIGLAIPLPQGDQAIPSPLSDALRQALGPVTAQLAPLGIEMKVVPGEETVSDDGTAAHALSAALQVTFRLPNSADRVTVEVGRARADAYLSLSSDEMSTDVGGGSSSVGAGSDAAFGEDAAFDEGAALDTDALSAPQSSSSGETPSSGPSSPAGRSSQVPTRLAAVDRDLVGRAKAAYLATLGALVVIGVGFVGFGPVSRTMFSEVRRRAPNGSN